MKTKDDVVRDAQNLKSDMGRNYRNKRDEIINEKVPDWIKKTLTKEEIESTSDNAVKLIITVIVVVAVFCMFVWVLFA